MGFSGIGLGSLLLILLIVLLIFGTKRLRNMGSDLGEAVKGFRQGMDEADTNKPGATDTSSKQTPSQPSQSADEHRSKRDQ